LRPESDSERRSATGRRSGWRCGGSGIGGDSDAGSGRSKIESDWRGSGSAGGAGGADGGRDRRAGPDAPLPGAPVPGAMLLGALLLAALILAGRIPAATCLDASILAAALAAPPTDCPAGPATAG